ncbi:MAG: hypothetical protein HZA91_11125 [Verrucomicrobia bacterium]|nr:hypothetical protein [Verrucomicrobiota bacterium]
MQPRSVSTLDRVMARACGFCPACNIARKKQQGAAFNLVKTVEKHVCPFCRAYERVYGRKAHEPLPPL